MAIMSFTRKIHSLSQDGSTLCCILFLSEYEMNTIIFLKIKKMLVCTTIIKLFWSFVEMQPSFSCLVLLEGRTFHLAYTFIISNKTWKGWKRGKTHASCVYFSKAP